MKRAENFYGLELYYGRLLLVYLMRPPHHDEFGVRRPPHLDEFGVMRPLGLYIYVCVHACSHIFVLLLICLL